MWGHHIICSASTLGYWEKESKFSDTTLTVATGTPGVSRVQVVYDRTTPTGTREDFAMFTLHMGMVAGWQTVVPLSDSQKADAEGDLDTFVAATQNLSSNAFTVVRYVWHDVRFGELFYGPLDRITTKSVAGFAASARMPDQIAQNVTLRTASRAHWGRFYLPGMGQSKYDTTYGRITNTTVDAVASAFRTLCLGLQANTAATELLVYSHKHQAALEVAEINMDNIPDVIRRRRPKMPSYRKSFTS